MNPVLDPQFDPVAMGRRLRTARKAQMLTQGETAARSGISLSFYGHIERGTRLLSVETLARLCLTLDLDAHYLIFGHRYIHSAQRAKTLSLLQEAIGLLQ